MKSVLRHFSPVLIVVIWYAAIYLAHGVAPSLGWAVLICASITPISVYSYQLSKKNKEIES